MHQTTEKILKANPAAQSRSADLGQLAACVDACFETAQACTSCADACLGESKLEAFGRCTEKSPASDGLRHRCARCLRRRRLHRSTALRAIAFGARQPRSPGAGRSRVGYSASVAKRATPTELDETWVWEAFRHLRLEGRGLYDRLAEHVGSAEVLAMRGDTLEIGGGDAHLWLTGGQALLARVLERGRLVITERDPALVATARAGPIAHVPGVDVSTADVLDLPFATGHFARVIAVHVLHWCGTEDGVRKAASEIARVLAPGGSALLVTVDERTHMRELYALLRRAADAVGMSEPVPEVSPRVLPFCASNATEILSDSFIGRTRTDWAYAHLVERFTSGGVAAEDFVERYVRTLPFVRDALARGAVPATLWAELRRLVLGELDAEGVLRWSRRDVLYECTAR